MKGVVYMYVWQKPGFGIGNQNQGLISVLVLELIFFTETETFFYKLFSNFSDVSHFYGEYKFL